MAVRLSAGAAAVCAAKRPQDCVSFTLPSSKVTRVLRESTRSEPIAFLGNFLIHVNLTQGVE